jgi:hypothetical protein
MAFALLSAVVNPAFPAWMRWMFAGFLVLALVQAAVAPWVARRSPPRQR